MRDDGRLQPPQTRLLAGDEPIVGTSAVVRDFWAWALSDLRANTVRPMLAEFLVAQARAPQPSRGSNGMRMTSRLRMVSGSK